MQLTDTGAIMFGDSLYAEQAERLIDQLSQTRYPFQCAHGRPSLVPLVRLAEREHDARFAVDLSQV